MVTVHEVGEMVVIPVATGPVVSFTNTVVKFSVVTFSAPSRTVIDDGPEVWYCAREPETSQFDEVGTVVPESRSDAMIVSIPALLV
jgi:hypothetical protein